MTSAISPSTDMTTFDVVSLTRHIERGQLNPVQLVESYLDRIRQFEPSVSSFVEVYGDEALQQAAEAASAISTGRPGGPLRGIPVVVKDLYDQAGKPTRAGSKSTSDEPATEDSAAVARLRMAGAVLLGKTTTHEFAFGVTTPGTHNPWDLSRIPGGSSGGSGAAMAADFAAASLGTDTGGSIRIPAALTNTVGFKPTFGRVSKRGVTTLSWSLDHAGPITKSVADAALLMNVLAGYDPQDPFSVKTGVEDYAADLDRGVTGLRLGVSEQYFGDRLDFDVANAFDEALRELERAGAIIVPSRFIDVDLSSDVAEVIVGAEAAAYHELRAGEAPEMFTEEVLMRIRAGAIFSGTALVNAHRVRERVRAGARELFRTVDAFVTPTVAMIAPPLGSNEVLLGGLPTTLLNGLNICTVPWNVVGSPALALPAGISREGMPISLQVVGKPFDEKLVLAIGQAFEKRTPWHTLRPRLG